MTDIRRFYKCGCEPSEEHFCKEANGYVWAERDAAMQRAGMGGEKLPADLRERLAWSEGKARGWLIEHFRLQEDLGRYEDVDFDAPEMQPPEDDYDPADLI